MRFSNEINLGHIFVAATFLFGGIASWVDLKGSDTIQTKEIANLQTQVNALATIAGSQTTQEMRINLLERSISEGRANRMAFETKMLDSVTSLRESVVEIKTQLDLAWQPPEGGRDSTKARP